MKISLEHKLEDIISLDNLLLAWNEFLQGKRNRCDVQDFRTNLMDNILNLHRDLVYHKYRHDNYTAFKVFDPKTRDIHKASVRDRLLHHAIYRQLYPFFDRIFIFDSYSCRLGKGTHKAILRLQQFFQKVSKNDTKTCWALKGDVKKFFASIDHEVLLTILKEYIPNEDIIWLLKKIIDSFSNDETKGVPLGNLTSQLFANIYLNKLDQFIKHRIRAQFYIRYADDFMILSDNKKWLENQISLIREFLLSNLKLEIHPQKLFIKTIFSGVDFLGWVNFADHRVLRRNTKLRMLRRLGQCPNEASLDSYLGLLKHGNTKKIRSRLLTLYSKP